MSYIASLQRAGNTGAPLPARQSPFGAPPKSATIRFNTPPAAQPHVEPPPYDVAQDPGWRGLVDPNDHELRNFLNQISPEERQMLLSRLQQIGTALRPGAVPPGVPPDIQQGATVPGLGAPGISIRPVPPI